MKLHWLFKIRSKSQCCFFKSGICNCDEPLKVKMRVVIVFSLLFILNFFISGIAYAQQNEDNPHNSAPIPLEVVLGNKGWTSQLIIDKKFVDDSKLGFFALSFLKANYDNDEYLREYTNLAFLKYDLFKHVSILSGAAYNSQWGFRPYAGGQYTYITRNLMCAIISGFYLTESHNYEALGMAEYRPVIKDYWSLYIRGQALYNHNIETGKHDRSQIYGRLGLGYKDFSFGCAYNYDCYGPTMLKQNQFGLFLSTLLK